MPHVKISYPHKTKDGTKRAQGEVVYLSSADAEKVVADGKGKVVKPSPEEAVKIAQAAKPKADKPAVKKPSLKAPPVPMPQVDRDGKKAPGGNSADG